MIELDGVIIQENDLEHFWFIQKQAWAEIIGLSDFNGCFTKEVKK